MQQELIDYFLLGNITMHWLLEPARIRFCERSVGGLIKHPADVWTNIGPLVAGIFILAKARLPLERLLGFAAIWTGAASAYFHARSTVLGETLDLSGMFLFILTVAALQQHRNNVDECTARDKKSAVETRRRMPGSTRQLIVWVLLLSLLFTGLSMFWAVFASPTFAVLVLLVSLREWRSPYHFGRWGWALIATFLLAWTFWWLDYVHVLCYPSNHLLTGHGIWHLLNGLVFWFTFKHFHHGRQVRAVRMLNGDQTGLPSA